MKNDESVVVYESDFGMSLSYWNKFMNHLWYLTAEKNNIFAKVIYYPLSYLEVKIHEIKRFFMKDKKDNLEDNEYIGLKDRYGRKIYNNDMVITNTGEKMQVMYFLGAYVIQMGGSYEPLINIYDGTSSLYKWIKKVKK